MKGRIRSFTPILPAADLSVTLDWYVSALGAEHPWQYGDPPGFAGCMLDAAQIHFSLNPALSHASCGLSLFVHVFDIDAYRGRLAVLGTQVDSELESKPWGSREFHIVDPNGVLLRFAEFGPVFEREDAIDVDLVVRPLTAVENKRLTVAVGWDSEDSGR